MMQKKLDRISLITRENLEGVRVIRAFSRQEKEKERFAQASEDQMPYFDARWAGISALLKPADQRHHQPGHRRGHLVRRLPGQRGRA